MTNGQTIYFWLRNPVFLVLLRMVQDISLPPSIIVREIYYYIVIPGFRTGRVSLITTLLDTTTYPTLEIVEIYGKRSLR